MPAPEAVDAALGARHRIEEARIREVWVTADDLALREQLL